MLDSLLLDEEVELLLEVLDVLLLDEDQELVLDVLLDELRLDDELELEEVIAFVLELDDELEDVLTSVLELAEDKLELGELKLDDELELENMFLIHSHPGVPYRSLVLSRTMESVGASPKLDGNVELTGSIP